MTSNTFLTCGSDSTKTETEKYGYKCFAHNSGVARLSAARGRP